MSILNRVVKIDAKKPKVKTPEWVKDYLKVLGMVFGVIFVLAAVIVALFLPPTAFVWLLVQDATHNKPLWDLGWIVFASIFWYSGVYVINKRVDN